MTAARLSVRALANLLPLPAYAQMRILHDQKYPKQAPQVFRIPYYQTALSGIRNYYRFGNDPSKLALARLKASHLKPSSKKQHNQRVINQFEHSPQAARTLAPHKGQRFLQMISTVSVSLQFDLIATENSRDRYLLYNFRDVSIDQETARATIEIAHWILETSGVGVPIRDIEYVNLHDGSKYSTSSRRAKTIARTTLTAQIIQTLWPTV